MILSRRVLLFLFCVLLSFSVEAGTTRLTLNDVKAVPYVALGEYISPPRMTLASFVLQLQPVIEAFSQATGYEACGDIGRNSKGRFGVILGSNDSHVACVNYFIRLPHGMGWTGLTIHSHGASRSFRLNSTDRLLDSLLHRHGIIDGSRSDLYGFSLDDYASGPGFLATPKSVLFQHGAGTTVTVHAGLKLISWIKSDFLEP